jgi:carbonic anhydrase/acetyltransferase-like protein (isoleucine patch superfamily)
MSNIFAFDGHIPVVHESSFIHPLACLTGNVVIGRDVYVGPGAAVRGDWGEVIVEDGCNIQENCVIHMFPGLQAYLEEGAHIGHGAIIHGARIGNNALIGMNSVIMDEVTIGRESIVGALTFVSAKTSIPTRSLVVGNPGKVVREVSDEMIEWKSAGTKLYQALPKECQDGLVPCEPLRERPKNRPPQSKKYKTWAKENQKKKPDSRD